MAYRVVHWGTGVTGREALRRIIEHPLLELAGVYVTNPSKVGEDAGDLAGIAQIGLRATNDLQSLINIQPDCLSYAGTASGREFEAAQDIAAFLERGIDVVTFSLVSMCYPPAASKDVSTLIAAACETGQSSFYCSGSTPGVGTAGLATILLSAAGQVDQVRIQEFILPIHYGVEEAMRESMGMGQRSDYVPRRFRDGYVPRWWTPMVIHAADLLNIDLEDIVFSWETDVTPRDLQTDFGLVEAGTIGALRFELAGMLAGKPVVVFEQMVRMARDLAPQWPAHPDGALLSATRVKVLGRPNMSCEFNFDCADNGGVDGAVMATALHVVNAIPVVVAGQPGVYGPDDIPRYSTFYNTVK